MEDIFIQKIIVEEVRNIKNFEIQLDDNLKKHLIITGKNGSGKTSLLNELKVYLNFGIVENQFVYENSISEALENLENQKQNLANTMSNTSNIDESITHQKKWFKLFGKTKILIKNQNYIPYKFNNGKFIVAFFEAKRNNQFKSPTGINKINFKPVYNLDEKAGNEFIQHIVNLKADRSFAKDDNDTLNAQKIDEWFDLFEKSLSNLFGNEDLKLQFDRKKYDFYIVESGKEPYNLNQLSDGFTAILNIVSELIMRMEEYRTKSYDVQGIVLIDEIETHLHIDLQKKVLPFLTSFFPKIQFIVTTHSPFVLNSIENAVICDLEKQIVTSDLSGYSYDTLVESYFSSDKYSDVLKNHISEYETLMSKPTLTDDEKEKLFELKQYLNEIPKFLSDELAVKLQQIRLKNQKKAV